MGKLTFVFVALSLCGVRSHVAFWNTPSQLQPVHGLYVKPSSDGTTGDLFVAASEDHGVKTQWLTDKPVNFLPAQVAPQALPYTYASSIASLPNDETIITNQKRAVIASPPIKYAYPYPGYPTISSENAVSYPYAVPAPSQAMTPIEGTKDCSETPTPAALNPLASSYPYALHYYYSHMLSAFANALHAMKDAGANEDGKTSAPVPQAMPTWPYQYPVQYVMMDPSKWAQSQTTTATPDAATTTELPVADESDDESD